MPEYIIYPLDQGQSTIHNYNWQQNGIWSEKYLEKNLLIEESFQNIQLNQVQASVRAEEWKLHHYNSSFFYSFFQDWVIVSRVYNRRNQY